MIIALYIIAFVLICLYDHFFGLHDRLYYHLPPGPVGLPIVGYLPFIDSKAPHITLTKLVRKFGPVCGLRMGSVYTVLLSDPRLIRKALYMDVFSGRAPLYLTHGIMQGHGIICAEGELWRNQRKFTIDSLKMLGLVTFGPERVKFDAKVNNFVDRCIYKLEVTATDDGFDPSDIIHHYLGNFINKIVFGKTYSEDDEEWKWLRHIQEEGVKHIGVAGPLNFLPFLRHFKRFGEPMKMLIDGQRKTHEIYRKIVQEYMDSSNKNNSVLAIFVEEMRRRKTGDPGYFTEKQMFHLLADLYGAGVDTTLTTIRWFLLFMAAYPEEQKKIQEEIESQLQDPEKARYENRHSVPRLCAAIAETQRLRSVVPLGIPHGTLFDTELDGFDIPKGTMIVPLQWAIHTDPAYWEDPLEFKPDRFIGEDGHYKSSSAYMPFQIGRRMCPGDKLARLLLFTFCARLLHKMVITPAPGATIDLEGEVGITLVPKPQKLVFTPRR